MAARKEKGKKSPTEAHDFPIIGWAEKLFTGKEAMNKENRVDSELWFAKEVLYFEQ